MKAFLQLIVALFAIQPLFSSEEEKASIPVETVTAIRSESLLTEIELTGTVVSRRFSGLSSRADGLIEEVMVDAGSKVKKGEVLLTLDTRFAEIELDLIRAEIEVARVQLRDAERKQKEVLGLTDSGAFAKSEAASLEATAQIRAAELKALEVREVQQLERITRHRLVAPFDGSIARKAAEAGEWVETGTTVFDLVETNFLWFELQVAQEFLAAIRNVEEATVVLDPFPEHELSAKIDVVVPVKDPVSRTFLTRLAFDDPDSLASPGMSGTALLQVRPARPQNVSIPRDAVTRHPDGNATVWTVHEEEGRQVARSVSVTTTGSLGETIEVINGLTGGEQVVVRGNEGLSEEDEVEATVRTAETTHDSL
ncbi:MAG: efflux RND transporter periplasmic adaptor subunit [Verrucomicrobiota bacterium]